MSSQIFPFIRLPVPVVSATYMTDAMVREGRRHEGDYFSRHCEIQGAPGTGFFDSEDRTAKPLVRKVMNQSPVSSLIGTMGESAAIQAIQREVELVARTNFSILVTGESGAGKELVGNALFDSHVRNSHWLSIPLGLSRLDVSDVYRFDMKSSRNSLKIAPVKDIGNRHSAKIAIPLAPPHSCLNASTYIRLQMSGKDRGGLVNQVSL